MALTGNRLTGLDDDKGEVVGVTIASFSKVGIGGFFNDEDDVDVDDIDDRDEAGCSIL